MKIYRYLDIRHGDIIEVVETQPERKAYYEKLGYFELIEVWELNPATTEEARPNYYEYEEIGARASNALEAAGYGSLEEVFNASDEELLQIRGIGPSTVEAIRNLALDWQDDYA